MTTVALATEDELSEAIGQRLLFEANPNINTWPFLRRGGFGYLRSKMDSWCELARHQPVFLLTDLDRATCPSLLISQWMGPRTAPKNLLLRVVVREIESWLLADHEAIRELIGGNGRLPTDTDALQDPKDHLLRLVEKHANRGVKEDILVRAGSVASQGLGYNSRLVELVANTWSPERAAAHSESLRRARTRLRQLIGKAVH